MQFTRLRLSGFKSFVDPTEFHIEPGLTGIVGPNGCGKSNLLEALRWVMGATSPKAMRGGGMDDVIFAGSGDRPSRNHAEVRLTIDNSAADGPAQFAATPILDVVRRIDRGSGSAYRINGAEARARDVQLLFADASTGANSPALVRQGQISELIAANPQNRRRILEEAAGVSGLYGRRHEAHLRVRGAEANLLRLDDLARELEAGLGRLKREARSANRYKKLAAEIRALRNAALHARWSEAVAALDLARAEAGRLVAASEASTRAAARSATEASEAQAALPALRDEALAAGAVLQRLTLENDRLDQALANARAGLERLTQDERRVREDIQRAEQVGVDAAEARNRLTAEVAATEALIAAAPSRVPQLEAEARSTEAARIRTEGELEAAAAAMAAAEADTRAARLRREAARDRHARLKTALAAALAEQRGLPPAMDRELAAATADWQEAKAALSRALAAVTVAEQHRTKMAGAESEARQAARRIEDDLGRKIAEAQGLASLSAETGKVAFAPVLNLITVGDGLEAALAAALGDDLRAALDPGAPAFWRDDGAAHARTAGLPDWTWPEGVTPLTKAVAAPPALAARLAMVGLVDRTDGRRLQIGLPPGARLVSREGDLWRWDGLTVVAEAPRPAQVRLEQRSRLTALQAEIERLRPKAEAVAASLATAVAHLAAAESACAAARANPRQAEALAARTGETVERLRQASARRDARVQGLDETVARFGIEQAEAEAAEASAEAELASLPSDAAGSERLSTAREAASHARNVALAARAALDQEARIRAEQAGRLETTRRDLADWARRADGAGQRRDELAGALANIRDLLEVARQTPGALEARRRAALDELAIAETRQRRAADRLAEAEAIRSQADQAARLADAQAANDREARAGAQARFESETARLAERAGAVFEATGDTPEALGRKLLEDAVGLPTGSVGVETHLAALENERDALGAVNLLAEDEAADVAGRLAALAEERADLAGALGRLNQAIDALNAEGRERLLAAFTIIDAGFRDLFMTLFAGGAAELRLVESDDPLEAGLEILACPPGKRLSVMSLMSGGEQALTAIALIFAVFLANPAPICVLDEVDAPLDDANVERFCDLLDEMRRRSATRFLAITHNPLTMSRMDRLFGVTMRERGVSQLVSVDLRQAEALVAP